MKIKEGDKLPDAKVFVLEKDPKEVSIKEIIGNDKAILFGSTYLRLGTAIFGERNI